MVKKEPSKLSDSAVTYANKVIAEMENESDRATAILLGAELDVCLEGIIEKHLLPTRISKYKNNAANNFHARIELVYRLGLLHPIFHNELHLIREIRNKFAHRRLGITFETSDVADFISKLVFPRSLDLFLEATSAMKPELGKLKNQNFKERFIASGAVVLHELNSLHEQIERVQISPLAIK